MAARVLDTNYLIRIYRGRLPGRDAVDSAVSAVRVARDWLRDYPRDAVVTPVVLELLGSTRDSEELRRHELFLAEFRLLDGGRVLPDDWRVAERLVRWIPKSGRSRGVIDCLVRAICNRLHAELATADTDIPG